jgi:hypothetical protein
MPNRTFHLVAVAICFHRINFVVVRCIGLEPVDAHSKDSIRMGWVKPDWRLGCLTKLCRLGPIVHNPKMLG